IIVSGRPLSGLVDDICGNVIRKPPIPDPPDWWDEDFGAAALFAMAAQFRGASKLTPYEDLRKGFADASEKLTSEGLARIG
ncbi:MAG: hypothetical protein H7070_04140, partial [Saprospiraceae bacterium]|nr:hypothetical protein [Pyrinomonadaceae bacterium]